MPARKRPYPGSQAGIYRLVSVHMPARGLENPAFFVNIARNCVKPVKKYHSIMKPSDYQENNKAARPRFTPGKISTLRPDEVFVFGSNLKGMHGGGAALAAWRHFGARLGQGVGLQGQSYAIPTMQGGPETIRPYVDEFIEFARQHRELVFYVTRIGCGIAGFRDEDIAPLFAQAVELDNVILPRSFWELIVCPEQTDTQVQP